MAERVPHLADIRRTLYGGHDVLHGADGARARRAPHVLRAAGAEPGEPADVPAGHSGAGESCRDTRRTLYVMTHVVLHGADDMCCVLPGGNESGEPADVPIGHSCTGKNCHYMRCPLYFKIHYVLHCAFS